MNNDYEELNTPNMLLLMSEQLKEEKATVDRVWVALGITTYETAKPFTVWEHVEQLKKRAQELESQNANLVKAFSDRMDLASTLLERCLHTGLRTECHRQLYLDVMKFLGRVDPGDAPYKEVK